MSTPEDEYKTVGLPPGARDRLARESERKKPPAATAQPRAADAPLVPPAAPPPPRKPGPPAPVAPEPESFATIPPAVGTGRRREPGRETPTPVDPWSQAAPTPPWGAESPAPPPAPPEAAHESVHSGWTMAGSPPAAPPSPWRDESPTGPIPLPQHPLTPQETPPTGLTPIPPGGAGPARPTAAATVGFRPSQPPPLAPPRPAPPREPDQDRANRTIAYDRNVRDLQKTILTLQFYNTGLRRWSDLGQVREAESELGRSTFRDWNPNPTDLAERHVRLAVDGGRVTVEPLPSLNGVFMKLKPNSPHELPPHARFRIGRHVLEFRPAPFKEPPEPLRAADGEVFQARTLAPLGFIDLIGPDGEVHLSHPLTKPDEPGARIGRGGPRCDLALAGDDWASSEHARIFFNAGQCWIEDLGSTNGTFLQISGPTPMRLGSATAPDRGDVVVLGGYMIRVVEERF